MASLVMMVYGGACLKYLFSIDLQPTVVPIFGLVYGGMSVLLCSAFGVWAATTGHLIVVKMYYCVVLPCLVLVLLAAAILSFGAIPQAGATVSQHFQSELLSRGPAFNSSEEDVLFKIQTQLLVAGDLCIFVCLFQLVGLFTAYKMRQVLLPSTLPSTLPSNPTPILCPNTKLQS